MIKKIFIITCMTSKSSAQDGKQEFEKATKAIAQEKGFSVGFFNGDSKDEQLIASVKSQKPVAAFFHRNCSTDKILSVKGKIDIAGNKKTAFKTQHYQATGKSVLGTTSVQDFAEAIKKYCEHAYKTATPQNVKIDARFKRKVG